MIDVGGEDHMEVGLIIILFLSNVFALDFLYNHRIKTTGAMLILNLCLTVALAYQFEQMTKIFYILLSLIGLIVLFFCIKYYLRKQKEENAIENDRRIEEKVNEDD